MLKLLTVKVFLFHIAGWVFYTAYVTGGAFVNNPTRRYYLSDNLIAQGSSMILFYMLSLKVLPIIFEKRQYYKGTLMFLFALLIFYSSHYGRIWIKTSYANPEDIPYFYNKLNYSAFFLSYFSIFVQFTAFALVYWFYHHSLRQQKEKAVLERRSHEIEISFLKSQINEHFTYNMLNRFHTEASKYSDQLADGILSLSDLMRYSVSEQENTMVVLSEEIKYTQMLIELNRQRLDNQVEVRFTIEGSSPQSWKIPHLCILTLVENAFKHGAIKQAPLELHLKVTPEQLWFSTKNKIKPSSGEPSTGIGVKNLQRRLDLLCQGRATLEARIENDYFYTEMVIQTPKSIVALITPHSSLIAQ